MKILPVNRSPLEVVMCMYSKNITDICVNQERSFNISTLISPQSLIIHSTKITCLNLSHRSSVLTWSKKLNHVFLNVSM